MTLTYENTSRMVKTRKFNLHINEAGDADAPAVVMLHGSGPGATGWSNFNQNIGPLSEHYRVVLADMPGWGESDPVTWQEREHSTTLRDLLDELDIDKASIIGNSMGGGTTIRFGYEHPERVHKLITMGASVGQPGMFGPGGLSEGIKILQQGYREPSFDTMKRLVDVMTFDSTFATDELIRGRAEMVASNPEHNKNFIDGIGKRAIVELDLAKLPTITAPTLLFHGRDDRVVHFENSLRTVQLIPNARLLLINRCGHWLQIEHAEEFNREVLSFLA
ncbi:MAG TPA: alpha/beta fold hydrolase [Propionibacterium sp.]|nr:alpha/beta fold hydrolase [Propionibacterium sp.]